MTIVPLVVMYVKSSACASATTLSNSDTQPQPQHRPSHVFSLFACEKILTRHPPSRNDRSHWRPAGDLRYANRAPSGRPVHSKWFSVIAMACETEWSMLASYRAPQVSMCG